VAIAPPLDALTRQRVNEDWSSQWSKRSGVQSACGTQYDPEAFLKTRRARVAAVPEKEAEPIVAEEVEVEAVEEAEIVEGEEPAVAAEGDSEEEEEELIEDASELGEDEDDMAEVIENVEDEEG